MSSPVLAKLQSETERRCATANIEPSADQAEATGAELRWRREARQRHEPSGVWDQTLRRPSVEVVRRRGEVGEGEKESEVMGVSCGRSTRVERTKLRNRRTILVSKDPLQNARIARARTSPHQPSSSKS